MDDEKILLETWKVAMDTQMHFNDLLIKMRTTVISIILAVFGGAAIALKDLKIPPVRICDFDLRISAVVIIIGLVFLAAQAFLDIFYYFRLLLGAVDFTAQLDKKHNFFGLTKSIQKSIPPCWAYIVLIIYYVIPFALGIAAIWIIQFKIPTQG
ncbi:hypothetical protein ACFL5Y_03650 [Candidatus Omnitrophota bacterium]